MNNEEKELVNKILNDFDNVSEEDLLYFSNTIASDYMKDTKPEDIPNKTRVELGNENIGTIYVSEKDVELAKKINEVSTRTYETLEYLNDTYGNVEYLSGWEYFSTYAEAAGMKFAMDTEDLF